MKRNGFLCFGDKFGVSLDRSILGSESPILGERVLTLRGNRIGATGPRASKREICL